MVQIFFMLFLLFIPILCYCCVLAVYSSIIHTSCVPVSGLKSVLCVKFGLEPFCEVSCRCGLLVYLASALTYARRDSKAVIEGLWLVYQ